MPTMRLPFADQLVDRRPVRAIVAVPYDRKRIGGSGYLLADRNANASQSEIEGENCFRRGRHAKTSD
jgi:hypothetical protein